MLLAAGLGSRLAPLTNAIPKPMAPIRGRPLLEHTVAHLAGHGIRDMIVNLHHLGAAITNHFGDGRRWGVHIRYSVEDELRGTAGALPPWQSFFDSTFLVMYGDNLTTCDIPAMVEFHRRQGAVLTIALSWRDDVSHSGMVVLDAGDRVRRFIEKPAPRDQVSHWVSAGVMLLEPEVIGRIPNDRPVDFGRDLLPHWIDSIPVFGYRMSNAERLWWIDTLEDLARVERELN
jgi:NDP-sugar pyrophosphorylase family protein